MEKQIPEIVKQAIIKQRAELASEREQVVRDIDRKIAELDNFLIAPTTANAPNPMTNVSAIDDEMSMTRKIRDTAKKLIVPGAHVPTDQIYKALREDGVVMPPMEGKPETARITRVVSGMGLYKGHKTNGWSLKENDPVGAGS